MCYGAIIVGTTGNDTIFANELDSTLFGFGGNDFLGISNEINMLRNRIASVEKELDEYTERG